MEVPMLEEAEFEACFAGGAERLPDVALKRYAQITGFRETNINAIYHHRISLHGGPCPRCGKPFRTPQARFCAACGFRAETATGEQRA